jgi:hypothetical protein
MQGKYGNLLSYGLAWIYRRALRARARHLIAWKEGEALDPGCTALIGMCSAMPDVLLSNLRCLKDHAWPELHEVIAVADTVRGGLDPAIERQATEILAPISFRLLYHTDHQNERARAIELPYVYSWLAWSIGLGFCKTRVALLHDYDALILSDCLEKRYYEFVSSGAFMQGIKWYEGNGILPGDRLATTFEAFLDVRRVRRYHPVRLLNELRIINGRSLDYDTLLDLEHNDVPLGDRTISPMSEDDLVHPSQMIHQYTMFRRHPGGSLPSGAIPMIPFFEALHAGPGPLARSIEQIRGRKPSSRKFRFLRDELLVNFDSLNTVGVDWALKQMVQVCVRRDLPPEPLIYTYGEELYRLVDTPTDVVWKGDFRPEHRRWIELSRKDGRTAETIPAVLSSPKSSVRH